MENKKILSQVNHTEKNKATPFIKSFFWFTLFMGFFVKSFYIQYSIKLTDVPYSDDGLIIKFIIISALLLTVSIPFIFGRFKYFAGLGSALLVGLILFADTLYGRYYGLPLSMAILYQLGFIDDVQGSTASLLKWKDIVFFLDLPVLLLCLVMIRKSWVRKIKLIMRGALLLAMALLVMTFSVLAKDVNTMHHAYERKNIAKDFGVYYYHAYDIKDTIDGYLNKFKSVDQHDLDMVLNYYDNKADNKVLDHTYEGYNLIVVQVEALQEFVVDLQIEGQAVTPYLNELKENNLYFENLYHQVAGGNTSDAEFLLNNSLYPAAIGAVNYLYPGNSFHSIAESLNELDYPTIAYHGYQSSFWNRNVMYNSVNYDHFSGQEEFVLDEKVGWAISDASFYRQALEDVLPNQPFYKFLITLSSHHPYDAFRHDDFNVGDYENTQVGDYLKGAHYVDQTIQGLMTLLEEKGVKDKTIVVIYGDHSALYDDQRALLSQLLALEDHTAAWNSIQKVPLWIITPDQYYQEVSQKVGGQVDILPTIAHLMNFDVPYALGHSLLNDAPGYAVKRDGSIFIEDHFYHKGLNTLYDLRNNAVVEMTDDIRKQLDESYQAMIVSDIILNYDLFSKKEFIEAFDQ